MKLVRRLHALQLKYGSKLKSAALLAARLVVGSVFAGTGWGKLTNLDRIIGYFQDLGIPAPQLLAPFVASVEFFGGLLVIFGVATRLAVIPMSGVMVVALLTAHREDIDGWLSFVGLQPVDYLVIFCVLFAFGAGAWSVDRLIFGRIYRHRFRLAFRHRGQLWRVALLRLRRLWR